MVSSGRSGHIVCKHVIIFFIGVGLSVFSSTFGWEYLADLGKWWCSCPLFRWIFFIFEIPQDILLTDKPTALRTLHFYNNMSGDGGAKALAEVSFCFLNRKRNTDYTRALLLCMPVPYCALYLRRSCA